MGKDKRHKKISNEDYIKIHNPKQFIRKKEKQKLNYLISSGDIDLSCYDEIDFDEEFNKKRNTNNDKTNKYKQS